MNIETFSEARRTATEKWREYRNAEKMSNNPVYKDLKKVYNQIKGGRKIIDIFKVIQKSGISDQHLPALAIAKASSKNVWCSYHNNGFVSFVNKKDGWGSSGRSPIKEDVNFLNWLPEFNSQTMFERGLHDMVDSGAVVFPD